MQQGIVRADVYQPGVSATVGGVAVDASGMRVSRAMPDPAVGGGMRAASVTLDVAHGPDVASKVPTPWDTSSWPPEPEAAASVSMDVGAGPVSVLTGGKVISVSGSTSSRAVKVELADKYQTLDQTISWEQVAAAMPSRVDDGVRRFVGMWTASITDTILRRCGWYSTPPPQAFSVMSVPAQGTMWAERGEVMTSADASTGTGFPRFGVTPWGVGTTDANATYTTSGGYSIKSRGRVELSAMTMASTGSGRVTAEVGTLGGLVRLSWSNAQGAVWIGGDGMTLTAVATVPRADGLLYATVEYVSDTSVRVILRSGTNTTTVVVAVPSSITTGSCDLTGVLVQDARSAGFQVAFPGVSGSLWNWTPNAVIHQRVTGMNSLTARWPVEAEQCVDLLDAQCEAEAATYWIDETGVLHWWDLREIEKRGTVAHLSSADDISSSGFSWSHSLASVKSGVTVKWTEAAQSFSSKATIDLWQGNGATLQPGTTGQEQIISVPDSELWIMPDLAPTRVGDGSYDNFNAGRRSHYGAVLTGSGTAPDAWAQSAGNLSLTATRISDTAFKLSTSWTGSAREAVQRTLDADTSSTLWKRRRDFDLPIIRGKSRVTATHRAYKSAITGPSTAPEMVVDASRWIQSEGQAQITADYYAARVTIRQPVLSAVGLVPVPGLQLGDIVTVYDDHATHLSIRGVVVEDDRSVEAGMKLSHSVTIRPLEVSRNRVTWAEWAQVARPKSWREWYLNQQPSTWAEWGADPLGKE